jgi:Cof subfamily protein (haloacid dehalogenase superfamily)
MMLFATDLDGTLVDRQDGIHPRDAAAIARARERGVIVTIATGRLTSRTHPIARVLELDAPLVCADGGVLACATSERVLQRRALQVQLVDSMLSVFAEHELASFVLTHDAVHTCELGRLHHDYLRGWASDVTAHEDLSKAEVWRGSPDSTIMLLAIGDSEPVARALAAAHKHEAHVDVSAFDIGQQRVLRLTARGTSKGNALAELATSLGITADRVAVAGDWFNDLSMFAYAGRSFAMPHAPQAVRQAATDVLTPGSLQRGAIADALESWLREMD